MSDRLRIQQLGPCSIDSPLSSRFFQDESAGVLVDATTGSGSRSFPGEVLEQAGPRRKVFFEPQKTRAAIVTCGGLCPGLNDVIRGVTMVLWHRYGITDILGLRYGYQGLVSNYNHQPLALTPEAVEDIHKCGGTILGSSRGPQDTSEVVDCLVNNEINILFAIGGDGTQRGVRDIAEETTKRGLPISVIGIPKTIDNDIAFTTRTFGFETAVAMSHDPINGAHNEAKALKNGVGLVKLMGRHSGFVAAYAALASSDVNLLLVPEVEFTVEAVLSFLEKRLRRKSHAVVVVAEGAGQDLVGASGRDISGNAKLGDIGLFLKDAITNHFKTLPEPVSVKYIDPSYIIRSAPATPDDSVFCFQLAENAVHAAMSGRTAMVIGLWNGHFVHVPVSEAVATRKQIDPDGPLWQSILDNTGQPL